MALLCRLEITLETTIIKLRFLNTKRIESSQASRCHCPQVETTTWPLAPPITELASKEMGCSTTWVTDPDYQEEVGVDTRCSIGDHTGLLLLLLSLFSRV